MFLSIFAVFQVFATFSSYFIATYILFFYAVNGFSAVHSLIAEKNSVIRRLGYIYM